MPDPAVVIVSFALLGLAPFVAVMVTSFAKLVVVMSLVRNALGVQQVPPNMVLNGLALVLSLYVMAPVVQDVQTAAQAQIKPGQGVGGAQVFDMLGAAREPLRAFLGKHAQPAEREFFVRSAARIWPKEKAEALTRDDLLVLVPAFTVSELTAAFKIGLLLYIVFVVIDLVVASILVALGMMMFSPTVVSVPLKLLLFVMLDGWSKLVHGLILTYQ
ncbi:type III secretion system export apparatus subunit SctR [Aquabacterium sp. A7-Y]|uniref:type III secretion system export apparatus subunit SctR n=1 Tax=Aquabacterium sp. A7-Y TaxID=1349605 RepID=UPI00223E45F8|nr:type III secretion system export apparatus subunit SctR [Aquabacterium sp. A7-Y]MCW7539739.1 type III secretion system export apparatus subunit SctR [Aquabacterium sp. A7-Y]